MASSDVDFMEAPVKHVISVKKERAKFGGAVFLPDGELLVSDKDNCRLLLFADDFFYQQEFKLPDKPYDITIGSDQKIYVTMFKNKLLKCEIDGDDLNILQTYDAPAGTYYLDAFNDQLVACCSGAFKILDSDGKEVQSFKRSGFETPMAVSTKQKRFYHKTDNSEVIGRKLSDGNEVFNFKDDSLSSVSGIALDCQDNVYATGFSSKNLVQISKNRRKHRVLVEKFNKVTKPASILFHQSKNLFVIFGQSDDFDVYQF
ncbi:unnamed protein product [Mytilus edulis]|uniref:Uncharacterized protein n=1 Tax=Mytilus edulis TaxID=6550 RepID=A0A8S3UB27_MYTED|nr:unnamed protein product [Mytilus edulis]